MGNALYFEIPDDREICARLVEAVPDDWAWVDGSLWASRILVSSGEVAGRTGFTLQRFHITNPTIIGEWSGEERKNLDPDLFAIIVEGKPPQFVSFETAGYRSSPITLALAKKIAAGLCRRGYTGELYFIRDCRHDSRFRNSAACSIISRPWKGPGHSNEAGSQPPRVRLQWYPMESGQKEHIRPLLETCRELGLREYDPAVKPVEAE